MLEMTSGEAALWNTVDAFYATATHPAEWDGALARLARLCHAEVAGIHVDARGLAHCTTARWHGLEPAFNTAYVNHYWREDPWWDTLMRDRIPGAIGVGEELVPRRTLERSAFHNELALRYGLDDLMAGVLSSTEDELVVVGIMGRRGMRFDATHRRTLERLLPHLTRAVTIGKRFLYKVDDSKRSLVETELRARYHLTEAEARVAAYVGRGLSTKETASVLGRSWNTVRAQLQRTFAKTRTRRQSELVRLIHSLDPDTRAEEPALVTAPVEEHLHRHYRLTPAETQVALHIGRGLSAKETAVLLGSRWNTVRSQLRQIYAKTRVSGQVDLTRLLTQLGS